MTRSAVVFVLVALAATTWVLGVPGVAAAATYTVTTTPITQLLTWQERTQTGVGGGELLAAAYFSGTMTWEDPKAECPAAYHVVPTSWQSTVDLSQYRFNSVSPLGVQRRKCAATTAGPQASNADCLPGDCPVKVTFGSAVVHPAQYAATYPVYSDWQSKTREYATYAESDAALSNCSADTTYRRSCARRAVAHPDRATVSSDRATCPASTKDVKVSCALQPTPTPTPVPTPTPTLAPSASATALTVSATAAPQPAVVPTVSVVAKRQGRLVITISHAKGAFASIQWRGRGTWHRAARTPVPRDRFVWRGTVSSAIWRVVVFRRHGSVLVTTDPIVVGRR